jgi:hypothetical protein
MIDLVEKFDRYEKKITQYLSDRAADYFHSPCYKSLQDRYVRLRDSNDMKLSGARRSQNSWKSNLQFPLVKERTLLRKAIFSQNYRGDPLFSLLPVGATTKEQANDAQDTLNMNARSTRFRQRDLQRIFDFAALLGTAVSMTYWRDTQKYAYKTIMTPFGTDRALVPVQNSQNAVTQWVHPLDYMREPSAVFEPSWQGHIDSVKLSNLEADYKANPQNYIKRNTEGVLREAKVDSLRKRGHKDSYKWDEGGSGDKGSGAGRTRGLDFDGCTVDVRKFYAQINIDGNEDDLNHYYIEMVGDKIVRIQHNPNDDDMVPYNVFMYYPRAEYWWGNTDAEFVIPHENFTNLIMGIKADRALNMLQQYIFHEKGVIDPSDWNNRLSSGGLISVDLKGGRKLQEVLHQFRPQDDSLASTDSIMREVKESQQKMTPTPDFTRGAKGGGLRNQTATAALILEEQGDVLESNILEQFNFSMEELARVQMTMLQQRLPQEFGLRPRPEEAMRVLSKEQILGSFDYRVETALTRNRLNELQRLQNIITGIMNFRGTGDPTWQRVDMEQVTRRWLQQADIGPVDEILQPAPAPQMQGAVPSVMMPGAEMGGAATPVQPQTQPTQGGMA